VIDKEDFFWSRPIKRLVFILKTKTKISLCPVVYVLSLIICNYNYLGNHVDKSTPAVESSVLEESYDRGVMP